MLSHHHHNKVRVRKIKTLRSMRIQSILSIKYGKSFRKFSKSYLEERLALKQYDFYREKPRK